MGGRVSQQHHPFSTDQLAGPCALRVHFEPGPVEGGGQAES